MHPPAAILRRTLLRVVLRPTMVVITQRRLPWDRRHPNSPLPTWTPRVFPGRLLSALQFGALTLASRLHILLCPVPGPTISIWALVISSRYSRIFPAHLVTAAVILHLTTTSLQHLHPRLPMSASSTPSHRQWQHTPLRTAAPSTPPCTRQAHRRVPVVSLPLRRHLGRRLSKCPSPTS